MLTSHTLASCFLMRSARRSPYYIRDYIGWYGEMIDVLAERFPHISTVIHYEDMLADPATALRSAAKLCGLVPPDGPLPDLGDDRGYAAPYRERLSAASQG